MKKLLIPLLSAVAGTMVAQAQELKLNDLEYFETRGVNILVYSNMFNGGFNDEKNSGLEVIHHGVRTVQGGAVRLSNTPEQWDLVPATVARTVNRDEGSIEVSLRYEDYDFDSRVKVTSSGRAVEISVYLDKPLPAALEGDAGFNLELLPSQYWGKAYLMDGRVNLFPRYAASNTVARPNSEKVKQFKGYRTYDDRGTGEFVDPLPLETGHSILIAPDSPQRMMKITCDDTELALYDGRILAQNGWFVLRSLLPSGRTGKVLTWTLEPNSVKDWIREPNIGFSQVGYIPSQPKTAVIELDRNDTPLETASVCRIGEDGGESEVFSGKTAVWGPFFKYNYVKFDFSEVRTPGIYFIKYGEFRTNHFLIDDHVYDHITEATSDVWIPIHLNHVTVNEGYRIWHGEPFREGYLQAPPGTDHFDLHFQGPTTDTDYKALELIPGLNVGGFFDAGDFDIETGANINVVQNLVTLWECFHPLRDETFISEEQRYVDLHRPDGTPDVLQFIRHGMLNLVAQAENIGHMSQCLSNAVLDNYHHLGDAAAITDGLHYDPSLPPYTKSADGLSSGTRDDMWAFTTRSPVMDMRASTVFAAAARALRGYDDDLARRALVQSKRLSEEASDLIAKMPGKGPGVDMNQDAGRMGLGAEAATNLQLYISTREKHYLKRFEAGIWKALDAFPDFVIATALDAVPHMDDAYKKKLRPYVVRYRQTLDSYEQENPYGIPMWLGNWAGSGRIVLSGTTACFAHKYYPDIVGPEYAYKVVNWLFGCHQYHNYSLVAAVGAVRPKAVFYGNNRADFSFIPGNVAPGLLFRNPDHFENYDDWPFLWGQNEGTIAGNTSYLIFGSAFRDMIEDIK